MAYEKLVYAIGDIHGCYHTLLQLLDKIEADKGSKEALIVFLGDYIDRGPHSALVVEHLKNLKTQGVNYVFLKGNHEDMLIKGLMDGNENDDYSLFLLNGGRNTIQSYEENNYIIEDHKDFYKSLLRFYQYEDLFFVHANLPPAKSMEKALNDCVGPYGEDGLIWAREWNNHDGKFPDDVFVIHGHTPLNNVLFLKNQINIDTSCVFQVIDEVTGEKVRGQLTGVRIDGRKKDKIKIFSVPRDERDDRR